MDRLDEKILGLIEEHNIRGEKIYWKKLTELMHGLASNPTIHKTVRELVSEERLIERKEQLGRAALKYLYVPGLEDLSSDSDKLDRILRNQEEILKHLKS